LRKLDSRGAHCRRTGLAYSRDALETASRVSTKRAHDKAGSQTGDKFFRALLLQRFPLKRRPALRPIPALAR